MGVGTKCQDLGMIEVDRLHGAGRLIWARSHCSLQGSYALALMISMNSGLRDAPPTRKPSTSFWLASSLQVAPVTEPEQKKKPNKNYNLYMTQEGKLKTEQSAGARDANY